MPPQYVTISKQRKHYQLLIKQESFVKHIYAPSLEDLYEENEWKLIMD